MRGAKAETINSSYGKVSYIDEGQGEAFLVFHGITGGYDQGFDVLSGRTDDYRVIAPSRFGYPGTDMPEGATVDMQVEEFTQLLDSLDIIIPVGFQEGSFGRLECKKAQLRRGDYWLPCNEYGEILINKTPFTEDQANELTDTILEMSKKIAAIVDEYRGTIDQALGRKGA